MRPRTRFWLDIVLAIALVAAWRPSWTGISLHQWLSIALVAPLLLHTVVNWDWAVRILRTFVERLLHTSRLNLVVDIALFVATVACMASGFMVSPGLLALVGIHVATSIEWHLIHEWSANAVIALLAVHGALHWRWLVSTAKRLAENPATPRPAAARAARPATAAAREQTLAAGLIEVPNESAPVSARQRSVSAPARRSRVGSRAAQAAKERASVVRLASLLGLTGALVLAVFVAEGIASPLFPATPRSTNVAAAGQQTCPATGCTASTCHGTTHADPYAFYGIKRKTKQSARSTAKRTVASTRKAARKRSTAVAASASKTVASAAKKTAASSAKKTASAPTRTVAKAAAPKKTTTLMTCPSTGCTASSCHGAHHQSASSYYK